MRVDAAWFVWALIALVLVLVSAANSVEFGWCKRTAWLFGITLLWLLPVALRAYVMVILAVILA